MKKESRSNMLRRINFILWIGFFIISPGQCYFFSHTNVEIRGPISVLEGSEVVFSCRLTEHYESDRGQPKLAFSFNSNTTLPKEAEVLQNGTGRDTAIFLKWTADAELDNGQGINVGCSLNNCTKYFGDSDCVYEVVHIHRVPLPPSWTGCSVYNWAALTCRFSPSLHEQYSHTQMTNANLNGTHVSIQWHTANTPVQRVNLTDEQKLTTSYEWRPYEIGATYFLTMTASNFYGTKQSPVFQVDTSTIVTPAAVSDLTTVSVATDGASLAWSLPRSDKLTRVNITVTTEEQGQVSSLLLTNASECRLSGLVPHTTYTATVRLQAAGSSTWSEPRAITLTTRSSVPLVNPDIRLSSFETKRVQVSKDVAVQNVIVRWKDVPRESRGGPGFGYLVRYRITRPGETDSSTQQAEPSKNNNCMFEYEGLKLGEEISVQVKSRNDVGINENDAPNIVFQNSGLDSPLPRLVDLVVIRENSSAVLADWAVDRVVPVGRIVFYWCLAAAHSTACKGSLHWFPPSSAVAVATHGSTVLPLAGGGAVAVGAAIELATGSSGIVWAECVYSRAEPPAAPTILGLESPVPQTLVVSWSRPRCQPGRAGLPVTLQARYRPTDEHKVLVKNFSASMSEITLENLEAGKKYEVEISLLSVSADGRGVIHSERVREISPVIKSEVFTAGVIIGVAVCGLVFLALFLSGVWVLMRKCKNIKKWVHGVHITAPPDAARRGVSESSDRRLMSDRSSLYVTQPSIDSGCIEGDTFETRLNASGGLSEGGLSLLDDVFPPLGPPPRYQRSVSQHYKVPPHPGSSADQSAASTQTSGFHDDIPSYSQLAQMPLPVYANFHPAGPDSNTSTNQLPAYVVAAVTDPAVYQNVFAGPPQPGGPSFMLLPVATPQGDYVTGAHCGTAAGYVAVPPTMPYVPNGECNGTNGRKAEAGNLPYVWLPDLSMLGPSDYVSAPPESVSHPVESSSMENLHKLDHDAFKHFANLSPIERPAPFSFLQQTAAEKDADDDGSETEADSLLPQPGENGNNKQQQPFTTKSTAETTSAAATYITESQLPPSGYVAYVPPPSAGAGYVVAAPAPGAPHGVFIPRSSLCALPAAVAAQRAARPPQWVACRAPALPRIAEVNSGCGQSSCGQSSAGQSSSGSYVAKSQAAAQMLAMDPAGEPRPADPQSPGDYKLVDVETPPAATRESPPDLHAASSSNAASDVRVASQTPVQFIPIPTFLTPILWGDVNEMNGTGRVNGEESRDERDASRSDNGAKAAKPCDSTTADVSQKQSSTIHSDSPGYVVNTNPADFQNALPYIFVPPSGNGNAEIVKNNPATSSGNNQRLMAIPVPLVFQSMARNQEQNGQAEDSQIIPQAENELNAISSQNNSAQERSGYVAIPPTLGYVPFTPGNNGVNAEPRGTGRESNDESPYVKDVMENNPWLKHNNNPSCGYILLPCAPLIQDVVHSENGAEPNNAKTEKSSTHTDNGRVGQSAGEKDSRESIV